MKTEAQQEVDELVGEPRYLNRELSRLDFYERVLALAEDSTQPLLERVKFLAFFSRFMDEFFQIRVAGLKEQAAAGLDTTSPDGATPREQLDAIRVRVHELTFRANEIFATKIKARLALDGDPDRRLGRAQARSAARAARGLRVPDLPGADAAGGRPGAPVPVHLEPLAQPRGRCP